MIVAGLAAICLGAGCKGMGGLGGLAHGFGHVASGFGKVAGAAAKGIGHAAPAVVHGLGTGLAKTGVAAGHVVVHAEPAIETTLEAAAAAQALSVEDPCNSCPIEVQCEDCAGFGGRTCVPGFDPAGIATCVTP